MKTNGPEQECISDRKIHKLKHILKNQFNYYYIYNNSMEYIQIKPKFNKLN